MPHVAMPVAVCFQLGPRDRQHIAGRIDANATIDTIGEKLQHASGAGSDIEQILGMGRKGIQQRLFDLALIDMKGADPVPLSGICRKIGIRFCSAHLLDSGKPRPIMRALKILLGYEAHKLTGHTAGCSIVIGEPVKNPATLAKTIEQPGVA